MNHCIILEYARPESLVDGAIHFGGIVISAQQQMAKALRKKGRRACGINELLQALLPDWHSPRRKLSQYLLLSRLIEENMKEAGENVGGALFRAFLNNRSGLIDSMRLLSEIGLAEDELPDGSPELKQFKKLYGLFQSDPASGVSALFNSFAEWEDPKTLFEIVASCGAGAGLRTTSNIRAVYFQGFYFVRPLQSRLIKALASSGVPVYFLNCCGEPGSLCREVWDKNPRFVGIQERRRADECAFDHEECKGAPKIMMFSDAFSMVSYLRTLTEKTQLLAPASKEVRELFETFFSPDDDKDSFLLYPVGRYLKSLYSMWDASSGGLKLDSETVRQCLASGWTLQWDADRMLEIYDRVSAYFAGCDAIEDWEQRLSFLKETTACINSNFKPDPKDRLQGRWLELAYSPFLNFGFFSESNENLDRLNEALHQMCDDARALFVIRDNEVDLAGHFKTLKSLLEKRASKVLIQDQERQIVKKFCERLTTDPADLEKCAPAHLADAMKFFLGGKRKDGDLQNDDEALCKGVRPLADIEAVILDDEGTDLLLCCCDERSLPAKPSDPPWPLSRDALGRIRVQGEKANRLQDYLYFLSSSILSSRHLFYHLALKHPRLTLSWTKNIGSRELARSVYLRGLPETDENPAVVNMLLLDDRTGAQRAESMPEDELSKAVDDYFAEHRNRLPVEAFLSRQFCMNPPMRFFYSYGLSRHPVVCSAFQMQFQLAAFISCVAQILDCSKESAAEAVISIFPFFSQSMKRQIAEYAPRPSILASKELVASDISLAPVQRLNLLFFPAKHLKSFLVDKERSLDNVCTYCPHAGLCLKRMRRECGKDSSND